MGRGKHLDCSNSRQYLTATDLRKPREPQAEMERSAQSARLIHDAHCHARSIHVHFRVDDHDARPATPMDVTMSFG